MMDYMRQVVRSNRGRDGISQIVQILRVPWYQKEVGEGPAAVDLTRCAGLALIGSTTSTCAMDVLVGVRCKERRPRRDRRDFRRLNFGGYARASMIA